MHTNPQLADVLAAQLKGTYVGVHDDKHWIFSEVTSEPILFDAMVEWGERNSYDYPTEDVFDMCIGNDAILSLIQHNHTYFWACKPFNQHRNVYYISTLYGMLASVANDNNVVFYAVGFKTIPVDIAANSY